MNVLNRAFFILIVGSWFSVLSAEQSDMRDSGEIVSDSILISDIGLEHQMSSAVDLVGSEDSAAGRNRAALVHRLRCWIDGVEQCVVSDLNDPRVRSIRRFLAKRPHDRNATVIVRFPDQTRIEVRLHHVANRDINDWDQSMYEPVVLPDTAQTPELTAIPSHQTDNQRPE